MQRLLQCHVALEHAVMHTVGVTAERGAMCALLQSVCVHCRHSLPLQLRSIWTMQTAI